MYTENKLNLIGYNKRLVPNSFFVHHQNNNRIAITFPGFGYLSSAPLLFYSKELLFENGFDVLSVDYTYNTDTDFKNKPEQQQIEWLGKDTIAAYKEAQVNNYSEILLLGKSFGTIATENILRNENIERVKKIVWMTPAIPIDAISKTIANMDYKSLFIVGDKDQFYREEDYKQLSQKANVSVKIYKDADHSMEIENDIMESIEMMKSIMHEIREFIKE